MIHQIIDLGWYPRVCSCLYIQTYEIFLIFQQHTLRGSEIFLLHSTTLPTRENSALIQDLLSQIIQLDSSFFLQFVSHFLSEIDHLDIVII